MVDAEGKRPVGRLADIESNAVLKSGVYTSAGPAPKEAARGRVLVFAGLFVMITASSSLYSLLAPFFPLQAEEKGVSTMLVSPISLSPRGKSAKLRQSPTKVLVLIEPLIGADGRHLRRLRNGGLYLLSTVRRPHGCDWTEAAHVCRCVPWKHWRCD